MTFEQYYENSVREILNNMVVTLESEPDMRFIYAEVCVSVFIFINYLEKCRNVISYVLG